jgi:hypothetical protein
MTRERGRNIVAPFDESALLHYRCHAYTTGKQWISDALKARTGVIWRIGEDPLRSEFCSDNGTYRPEPTAEGSQATGLACEAIATASYAFGLADEQTAGASYAFGLADERTAGTSYAFAVADEQTAGASYAFGLADEQVARSSYASAVACEPRAKEVSSSLPDGQSDAPPARSPRRGAGLSYLFRERRREVGLDSPLPG